MLTKRILGLLVLLVGGAIGYFIYSTTAGLGGSAESKFDFKLGLDLSGGTSLVYRADVSNIDESEVSDAMDSLRDVIERRINLFGVSETTVLVQDASFINEGENRIVIELPGVTDINEAVSMIGQTPLLEFKTERPAGPEQDKLIADFEAVQDKVLSGEVLLSSLEDPYFVPTPLTGRFLERATLEFSQGGMGGASAVGGEPMVVLTFNKEGSDLFEKITGENVDKLVAIYLDGAPISTPVVREAITGGEAVISGSFTPEEAKQLVGRLNSGALPVPIELISTQTVGPSLGAEAVDAGVFAALIGFGILSILILFWYRLPGLIAIIALVIYSLLMFAMFKLVPVTLTAAGIAGFILSLGMAVDANILIFERMKEEMRSGKTISDALENGFDRAWSSIRDSNLSSMITAVILFWFGTALIKGFALTFGLGVLVSMVSAIIVSKVLLLSITSKNSKVMRFLFSNGITK
ncbi:MAG: preprotein translocase subunit SecD [Patescibacteria group bacterium]|nr:preprotein translocase subunit SecD [Patescibacteria group bacterium]